MIFLDWSRPKLNVLMPTGEMESFRSVQQLCSTLRAGWPTISFRLVYESTYGSFSPEEKTADITTMEAFGYTAWGYHSRHTAKQRRNQSLRKDDLNDLLAIALQGRNHPLRRQRPEDTAPAFPSRTRHIRERKSQYIGLRNDIQRFLPSFRTLDPECQRAFGADGKYSNTIASVLVCAFQDPAVDSCKSFERVIGLYGNGRGVFRSAMLYRMYKDRKSGILRVPKGRFQYWLRWMYHRMAESADISISQATLPTGYTR
jgi:hypothetical protein